MTDDDQSEARESDRADDAGMSSGSSTTPPRSTPRPGTRSSPPSRRRRRSCRSPTCARCTNRRAPSPTPAGRRTSSPSSDAGELVAACPLYLKDHSYGEYVFDWAWADAYRRHGLDYYPKLLDAMPFTPVPGPRLLARTPSIACCCCARSSSSRASAGLSSAHLLFLDEADQAAAREAGWSMRTHRPVPLDQPRARRRTPTSPTSWPACSATSARRSSRSGAVSPTPASPSRSRRGDRDRRRPTGTSSTAATPSPTARTIRRRT